MPGDKSISHRALMMAALASGTSRIAGILQSDDVQSTASVLRRCGVGIPALSGEFGVRGGGRRSLRQPDQDLDCGNSGTTARLMAGILAGHQVAATFTGDASLSRRPMRRVARPLEEMGARVDLPAHGGLPMTVVGGGLRTIDFHSETGSAQVKSAVLLAGLTSGAGVSVVEAHQSRDHTERMLIARGAHVGRETEPRGHVIRLAADQSLHPLDCTVPGDPSSAAFFIALAALSAAGELALPGVCLNPSRIGAMSVFARMGATLVTTDAKDEGGEPLGTVVASGGALRGVDIGAAEIPSLIDELPIIACVAARASGTTTVAGAGELRVKESDRIAAIVGNLRAIGADAEEMPDGFRVQGSERPLRGRVTTHGDHRIAMAFGILGAVPGNAIDIDDPGCVSVSYPAFWDDLRRTVSP